MCPWINCQKVAPWITGTRGSVFFARPRKDTPPFAAGPTTSGIAMSSRHNFAALALLFHVLSVAREGRVPSLAHTWSPSLDDAAIVTRSAAGMEVETDGDGSVQCDGGDGGTAAAATSAAEMGQAANLLQHVSTVSQQQGVSHRPSCSS